MTYQPIPPHCPHTGDWALARNAKRERARDGMTAFMRLISLLVGCTEAGCHRGLRGYKDALRDKIGEISFAAWRQPSKLLLIQVLAWSWVCIITPWYDIQIGRRADASNQGCDLGEFGTSTDAAG